MSDKHNPIGNKNQFVCEPDDKYRDNCEKPGWKGKKKGGMLSADEFAFAGKKTSKEDGIVKYYKVPHEAHHILSVSCVNNLEGLSEPQKNIVRRCCHETDWNINNKDNLIPLPLFGHSLKWYVIDGNTDSPGWADWPQHDWDHNSTKGYCADVKKAVLNFYETLELQGEGHTATAKSIQNDLVDMQTDWRTEITERGQGTHDAWVNKPDTWYYPFSMAKGSNATYRPKLRIENKIAKLKKLLAFFGGAS